MEETFDERLRNKVSAIYRWLIFLSFVSRCPFGAMRCWSGLPLLDDTYLPHLYSFGPIHCSGQAPATLSPTLSIPYLRSLWIEWLDRFRTPDSETPVSLWEPNQLCQGGVGLERTLCSERLPTPCKNSDP